MDRSVDCETRAATLVRGGEAFVFRYLPTPAGRCALYSVLLDYLRRGAIEELDVQGLLLSLDSGHGTGAVFTG
jgi:hypothetical protein